METRPSKVGSPFVELRGITKVFGGTVAVDDADLAIESGSVHALVGENGAGKSTLGKIIAGVHAPDRGVYSLDGVPVSFRSPGQALRHGVTMIAQELALVPSRTVIENVFLGLEPTRALIVDRKALRRRFTELLEWTEFDVPETALVGSLSVAQQQLVELLRAVARNARLIVMDEPTARLAANEVAALHEVIRILAGRGTTVVLVSHFLDEVLSLADTITVLRDGRVVRTAPASSENSRSLVAAMIGRDLEAPSKSRERAEQSPVLLAVKGLGQEGTFANISFSLRAGEVVGLAGLVGSGRSEVARAVFGADPWTAGSVWVRDTEFRRTSIRRMVRAGVAMVPESRKTQGLFLGRSVRENVTLTHLAEVSRFGFVRRRAEQQRVSVLQQELGIKLASIGQAVSELSGGNQQKVLLARWIMRKPRVIIVDEPTRGVDIGAKFAIHEAMRALAQQGAAVLLISSELEEVIALADRVLIMREGSIVDELAGERITAIAIMNAAFGTLSQEETHA